MNRYDDFEGTPAAITLYGGKGGVGKTTCAAAHALALARRDPDKQTLVVSTDPAHSLGDAFECNLRGKPTVVEESLSAVEVDPESGQQAYRRVVMALADEFRDAGLRLGDDDLERLFEVGLTPGGDEIAALEYIARYAESEYDHVVFDTAPTGHTLRLLDIPSVLSETLSVAAGVQRRVRRTARVARSVVFGPAAYWDTRGTSDEVASLRERADLVEDLLCDSARVTFRVVLTPERMAIAETERLLSRLDTASVPVDSLVVNRVFENAAACLCDRCQRDADRHARRLSEIDERFDLPAVRLPELAGEAHGREPLSELGLSLLSEQ